MAPNKLWNSFKLLLPPLIAAILIAMAKWLYDLFEQGMAQKGWAQMEPYILAILPLIMVVGVLAGLYPKVFKSRPFSTMGTELDDFDTTLPTYALWARVIAWAAIWGVSLFFDNLRPLLFTYTTYLCGVMIWSTKNQYHTGLCRVGRALGDMVMAVWACWQYGGFLGPSAALFLIPLTSLTRNFSAWVGVFFTTVFIMAIGFGSMLKDGLYWQIQRTLVGELFTGNGLKAAEGMVAIYQLNHLVFICAMFALIAAIMHFEHRGTYYKTLRDLAGTLRLTPIGLEEYLDFLPETMRCQAVLLFKGSSVFLSLHPSAQQERNSLQILSSALAFQNQQASHISFLAHTLCQHRSQGKGEGSSSAGSPASLLKALLDKGILPEAMRRGPMISLEYCSLGPGICLIALNHYTRNLGAFQRFTPEAADKLRILALKVALLLKTFPELPIANPGPTPEPPSAA